MGFGPAPRAQAGSGNLIRQFQKHRIGNKMHQFHSRCIGGHRDQIERTVIEKPDRAGRSFANMRQSRAFGSGIGYHRIVQCMSGEALPPGVTVIGRHICQKQDIGDFREIIQRGDSALDRKLFVGIDSEIAVDHGKDGFIGRIGSAIQRPDIAGQLENLVFEAVAVIAEMSFQRAHKVQHHFIDIADQQRTIRKGNFFQLVTCNIGQNDSTLL